MRILLVNSFYYRRGGDSAHVLDLERLLTGRGHDVAVLSMHHPKNAVSPWSRYWVPRVEFRGADSTPAVVAALRSVHSREAAKALAHIAADFAPDVVHVHAVHHHLSTSVVAEAKKRGFPVVWTLHEYRTVCPATNLLRRGRICEECAGGRFWHGLLYRCKSESAVKSAAAVLESYWSRWRGVHALVDCYISPSDFLAQTVMRMGLPARRIEVLPNFCELPESLPSARRRRGVAYVGRLSPEKGVDVLLRACAAAGVDSLEVVGDGPAAGALKAHAHAAGMPVSFAGWLDKAAVWETISRAQVLCVPSVWYENCPIVALEAMALGTPVLATDLGGLPELLDHGRAGILTPPGDAAVLASALRRVLAMSDADVGSLTSAARQRVATRHAPASFVAALERIYESL